MQTWIYFDASLCRIATLIPIVFQYFRAIDPWTNLLDRRFKTWTVPDFGGNQLECCRQNPLNGETDSAGSQSWENNCFSESQVGV